MANTPVSVKSPQVTDPGPWEQEIRGGEQLIQAA